MSQRVEYHSNEGHHISTRRPIKTRFHGHVTQSRIRSQAKYRKQKHTIFQVLYIKNFSDACVKFFVEISKLNFEMAETSASTEAIDVSENHDGGIRKLIKVQVSNEY